MSDGTGSDDVSGHAEGWDAAAEPTSGSTPRIAEPVPHSRLIGLMAEPVSRSVPLRRSTVLMVVAFLGFGTLTYLYPPNRPTNPTPAANGGVSGTFIPLTTTPTPHPTTTTTTSRPGGAETTTTTTTTTRPTPTTTTTSAPVAPTTTTASGGSTTTTSTSSTTTTAP